VRRHKVSERRACRVVGQHRSAQRYVRLPDDFEARLVKEMRGLAETHPRWGYRQIHALLVAEGWKVNRKRIERLWRLEGLKVPPSKSKQSGKKAGGGSQNAIWNLPAVYPDHIWTFDFMTDRTVDGEAFRILNIIDEYTRVCVEAYVARHIGARRVIWVLERLFAQGVKPKIIRSDNGREFIAGVLELWLGEQAVTSAFVEKGSPQQNAFIESFNAGMRRECLNFEEFHSVLEARVVIAEHVELYNTVRRHRALGMKTPAAFAVEVRKAIEPPCLVDSDSQISQDRGGSKKRGR
jgi:putative transposase